VRKLSVADYFVEFLIANGVTDVFGYQGGMIAYIFDSLGKYRDRIRYHSCATEQGAALAACGYAQSSGKLGVAISTSGPGFTNLITGIANAWFDSVPVLFVSGNVNTKDKKRDKPLRQLGFQEIQAASVAEKITKRTYEFELDMDYVACLEDIYRTAMTARKGPVYLDLPINVCREQILFEDIQPVSIEKEKRDFEADVFLTLDKSKKPVIIAGAGIKEAGCVELFRKVIECLKIPVVTTLPAVDVLPSDSMYYMGYIGGTARREAGIVLQNADFVLSIGTRLCSKQIGHNLELFAPKARYFFRVDIDDDEFCRQLKDCEQDILADIEDFLTWLLEESQRRKWEPDFSLWANNCAEMHSMLKDSDLTEGNQIFRELTGILPSNVNLLLDVGKNLTYGGQSAIIKEKTSVYMSAGLGTMGYALPAAIGAYYGNGNPTVAVMGDGGAQMNIQELNTIVKNKLPIKVVVLNNRALGNIRIFQEQYLDSRFVATSEAEGDYFSCDFGAIARAYGMKSYLIENMDELDTCEEILDQEEATLLEILYEDCPALPGIVAGGEFLKEGSAVDKDMIERIRMLMD
jgi:acetolactate synthase-1/2/3 large subunit